MKSAVVVDCVRTPIGRSHREKGVYRTVRSDDLAVSVVAALLERTGIPPREIEDVVMGNSKQEGEQGLNVARMIALMAGVPMEAAAATVNRLCGSSLQALNQAAHSIMAGFTDVHIVGGLEHMDHVPMDATVNLNPRLFRSTSRGALNMGITAEFLAQSEGIARADQDAFALASHTKAAAAQAAGDLRAEMVPVWGRDPDGRRTLVEADQSVRPDTTAAALAALKPAFLPRLGTVTAGNSSPMSDGAAAMLVMSETKARELGLAPLVRVVATAVAGVPPAVMGTGPVPATEKVLRCAGMRLTDVDLIELNEAFAAQSIACIRRLKIDQSRLNVRGGAIAIGHPLGASGARIATTLIRAMIDRDVNIGLVTMCIGFGQGIATLLERV